MIQTSYINKRGLAKNLKITSNRLKYTHVKIITMKSIKTRIYV